MPPQSAVRFSPLRLVFARPGRRALGRRVSARRLALALDLLFRATALRLLSLLNGKWGLLFYYWCAHLRLLFYVLARRRCYANSFS